jgi:hypothetical protein
MTIILECSVSIMGFVLGIDAYLTGIIVSIKKTMLKGLLGYMVANLVEALPYKLEGRGFDSRLCH